MGVPVLLAHTQRVGSKRAISGADRAIGARIREARERLGVSINDLGLAYGASRQTAQFWEKGMHFPPLSEFPRLCNLLRMDANQILGMQSMRPLTEEEALQAKNMIQAMAYKAKVETQEAARSRGRGLLQRRPGA